MRELSQLKKALGVSDKGMRHLSIDGKEQNTQRDTVGVIRQQNGHYVGGLKGNQQVFHKEVKLFFCEENQEVVWLGLDRATYEVALSFG